MEDTCLNCKHWIAGQCCNKESEYYSYDEEDMMHNLCCCDEWEGKDEEKVNHPSHYQGRYECIEEIKAMLTPEEYRGFLKGTFLKYRYRKGRKADNSAEQDESKAEWYMDRLMKEVEKE